jgi:hypothetical protein
MVTSSLKPTGSSISEYALGYTQSEHYRLIRQAARVAPVT